MRATLFIGSVMILVTSALPALTACGGGGTGGGGGGGGGELTADAACKSLGASVCGRLDACAPFLIQIGYGEEADCEGATVPRCVETAGLSGTGFDAAAIKACADDYAALSCGDVVGSLVPASCRPGGQKDDGAVCATGPECKGGICRSKGEGQCGTCATPLAEGASCDASVDACAVGTFCGASAVCEKFGAKGAACDDTSPCLVGLSCNGGVCGDALGNGADCSGGGECDLVHGLFCDPLSSVCKPFGIAKLSEDCGYDQATMTLTLCEANGDCDDSTNKCIARLGEGDACTVDMMSGMSRCGLGLACIGGKCSKSLPSCQ